MWKDSVINRKEKDWVLGRCPRTFSKLHPLNIKKWAMSKSHPLKVLHTISMVYNKVVIRHKHARNTSFKTGRKLRHMKLQTGYASKVNLKFIFQEKLFTFDNGFIWVQLKRPLGYS